MMKNDLNLPQIILITGNMASGKSSVAQSLAEQIPRSVHLRGDLFRRMIVNGQVEMSSELSSEAEKQLSLRYDLAIQTAKKFVDSEFTVVYQDIVLGDSLSELESKFLPYTLSIIVLCPNTEVVAERDQKRKKTAYRNQTEIEIFDRILHKQTSRLGYWLDTSNLTLEDTVNNILFYLKN